MIEGFRSQGAPVRAPFLCWLYEYDERRTACQWNVDFPDLLPPGLPRGAYSNGLHCTEQQYYHATHNPPFLFHFSNLRIVNIEHGILRTITTPPLVHFSAHLFPSPPAPRLLDPKE